MKITLAAGESKPVTLSGAQFYYLSGSGKIEVKIVAGGNARTFELSPGMGFRNDDSELPFYGVEIRNLFGSSQDIEFEISYRQVFDNRVSFGDISTDDFLPLKARTNSYMAFMKNRYCGNLASLFCCVALRNPVGSTRNCWVRKIFVGAPSVGRILIHAAADMAAAEANAAVSNLLTGGAGSEGKKAAFGPGSNSQSVTDSFLCNAVGFTGAQIFYGYCQPGQTVIELAEPIKLVPGNGIWVTLFETNVTLGVSFEIVEEAI